MSNPMDCSTLGFPVLHHLPEIAQTHVHWSQWCHPTISIFCHPLLPLPSIFPSIRVFSSELAVHIRWPKYWSFSVSISPCSEYSGLISWFELAVQGTQESSLASQFKSTNYLVLSLLYGPTLTCVHDSDFFKKFNNIIFNQDLMHC